MPKFAINQNFPNPFNSTTTIEFSLPNTSFVTLKIYNLFGEQITTLVSEKLSAGSRGVCTGEEIDFDALNILAGLHPPAGIQLHHINERNLPIDSDVYFCRIESMGFV